MSMLQKYERMSRHQIGTFIVVVVLGVVLFVEVGWRISFPWDLYVWSESPFLTNMLKLENGSPIFTSPEDANSFVYSPGLEYITWFALKPFNLQLDMRFIRLVNVAIGFVASGFAALVMKEFLARASGQKVSRPTFAAAWLAAILIQFKNFTADVSHPDNLVQLHAMSVLWLTLVAQRQTSFRYGLIAIIWAGAGVLWKQTQIATFMGVIIALALTGGWRGWQLGFLAMTGVASAFLALKWLWASE